MPKIECPKCNTFLGTFIERVETLQGSIKCPECGKSFGFTLRKGKVLRNY